MIIIDIPNLSTSSNETLTLICTLSVANCCFTPTLSCSVASFFVTKVTTIGIVLSCGV